MKSFFAFLGRLFKALFNGGIIPPTTTMTQSTPKPISSSNENAPVAPAPVVPNPDILAPDWDTQQHAYHNVRVLCDLAGLTFEQKNIICACIYQESRFKIGIKHANVSNGVVESTDYGICQINDYYHIGAGKDFPSAEYVLDNPDKAVAWMIQMYQRGSIGQWVSYSSGAYRQWLVPSSPMWLLAK